MVRNKTPAPSFGIFQVNVESLFLREAALTRDTLEWLHLVVNSRNVPSQIPSVTELLVAAQANMTWVIRFE